MSTPTKIHIRRFGASRGAIAALAMALVAGVACSGGSPSTGNGDGNTGGGGAQSAGPPSETIGRVQIYRDLPYETVDGVTLALDIYRRPGPTSPGLMVVHGGGWRTGTKDGLPPTQMGVRLASQGFTVAIIDYRLAPPGGRWHAPAPIIDCRKALEWLRDHGRTYGMETDRIGALGGSAGGHLAMLLATTGTKGRDKVDAAVSFSGPTDLGAINTFDAPSPNPDIEAIRKELVFNFMGCRPKQCPELYRQMSPASNVDQSDSPIFEAISTEELVPLPQAKEMHRKLDEAGVDNELQVVPGVRHGLGIIPTEIEGALTFLRAHLGGDTAGGGLPIIGRLRNGRLPWRIILSLIVILAGAALVGVLTVRRSSRRLGH